MENKKKVLLQINSVANWGSIGKDAEGIGKAAIERGWDSYIAYGRWCNPSASHLIRIGTDRDNCIHALCTRLFDNEGINSKKATKALVKKIKELNPDLIILHNLHGYYLNYPILFDYLKESKSKVIYSIHDCWAFTGHCNHFELIGCDKWKTLCEHCPQLSQYPNSWFLDRSRRNFLLKKEKSCSLEDMLIVGVSDWVKHLAENSFLGKYRTFKIFNGINTETFVYREGSKDKWPGKKIIMGVASRFGRFKGTKDYLALSKIISSDYLIVMVGHIDDDKIRNSLPDNIVNIERTQNQIMLAELYSRADVTISLSYQETLGLTTIEGMACGTPGIVYNATASPELITPETGLVVEPGNIDQVWNAIQKIVSEGKAKYSEACRKRAITEFDELKQFSKYIDLYEENFVNMTCEKNK